MTTESAIDPSTERYDLPLTVEQSDIDQLGHVNNTVYLRWVQEAAVAHWTAAATKEQYNAVIWVVVRHEIDYLASIKLGEAVTARTWVGATVKNYFERFTEIIRTADGKILARTRTLWCPLDRATGRPTRVGEDIRKRFSVASAAV
ncbi:MAG: acyl-CoA thioesterase [Bacteroidota bacterium]